MAITRSDFFRFILENTSADIELRFLPSAHRVFTRDMEVIDRECKRRENEHCYFGVNTRKDGGKAEHVQEVIWFHADLDFKEYQGGEAEAKSKLKAFPLTPTAVIHSGNGYHAYWALEKPVTEAFKHEAELKAVLRGIARTLGADIGAAEIARILRIPETYNHKNVPAKPIKILKFEPSLKYPVDAFTQYAEQAEVTTGRPQTESLAVIVERCEFLKYCHANREALPEPLWYAMISNVARLQNGVDLCHEFSDGYTKYSPRETERKILHAINASSPMSCQTIRELMKSYGTQKPCEGKCGYKSPAGLLCGRKVEKQADGKKEEDIETLTWRDVIKKTLDYAMARHENKSLSGIPSGIEKLDAATDGFQPGNLIMIAARPSIGKSALMTNIIIHVGEKNTPVGLVSLEMTDQENGLRALALKTGVSMNKTNKGSMSADDWVRYSVEASHQVNYPIFFQRGIYDEETLKRAVKILVSKGCRIVFIDHLHLMRAAHKQQSREREIALLTATGKQLAQQYDIPVVYLSQLNRDNDKQKREPQLIDLRDSGSAEQDSDVIIFLHEISADHVRHESEVKIILAKGRNIGKGQFKMKFRQNIAKFELMEEKEDA